MEKDYKFSILIANYNNGQFLEECLQSVFDQTYTNWEIILVDDGSTDLKSWEIYEKYKTHPKIKIFINDKNKGCGYTKNRCVKEATGFICGFLDPDDTITSDALEIMVNMHLENPQKSLIYSTNYLTDRNLNIIGINNSVGELGQLGYFCGSGKGVSAFASFKLEKYALTTGIDPSLKRAVDQDLYYKLEETGSFRYIDKPLYLYRRHPEGISTANNSLKAKYWHALVATETYKRRKINNYQTNQKWSSIKRYWEDYYFWKAEEKAKRGEVLNTIYLSINAIYYGKTNLLKKLTLIPYSVKTKLFK